jgi:hypothetical protein
MKNYSSRRAKKGKIAYRTPGRFFYQQYLKIKKWKAKKKKN